MPKNSELEAQQVQALKEVILEIIKNPVFELILGYVIVEKLQKNGTMPQVAGNVLEGAIIGSVSYQQLAPILPGLLSSSQQGMATVSKLLPLLAV